MSAPTTADKPTTLDDVARAVVAIGELTSAHASVQRGALAVASETIALVRDTLAQLSKTGSTVSELVTLVRDIVSRLEALEAASSQDRQG